MAPYSTNTMGVTNNVDDFLFRQGANGDDPIVRYAFVDPAADPDADGDFSAGLFAWIRFGIDQTADKPVSPAAFWTEEGGVMNPDGPIAHLPGGGNGGWPGWPGTKREENKEKK